MNTFARLAIDWVERGYIPDAVIRDPARRHYLFERPAD